MIKRSSKTTPLQMQEIAAVEYGTGPEKRMFSPASFFDVIDARHSDPVGGLGEPREVPESPAVVAFYGFKGGAGRTMALAHVAMMLAQRGLRVAAIDFDLEAPGLHLALGEQEPADENTGLVPLLHEVLSSKPEQPARVLDHVQVLSPKEGVGKVFLLPAGKITQRYLAQIEELGPNLWHISPRSPLDRVLDGLRAEHVDVILIDCRTGFNGMSASILFHYSDLAVVFFPLSEQVWNGVEMLLMAAASARAWRTRKPALLFVPSMVPPGATGLDKTRVYLTELNARYSRILGNLPSFASSEEGEESDADLEDNPWIETGICWDPRLSAEGAVQQPFMPGGAWGIFQPLRDRIVEVLDLTVSEDPELPPPSRKILGELDVSSLLAFAEDQSEDQMQRFLVPSQSVKVSLDRNSALIVGAKGAGKTLLWRYLVESKTNSLVPRPENTEYLVGHAPKSDLDPQGINLSADAFKELEQAARMEKVATHKVFWILYALVRLSLHDAGISEWVTQNLPPPLRSLWRSRRSDPDWRRRMLSTKNISTSIEDIFARLDRWLAEKPRQLVLVYDGLDTGFQTGQTGAWYERRERFVTGLLQVVADWRTRLHRIQFKVFLREDIYLSILLQNRSHLDSTKHDLRFGPPDLWQLALKIACTSQSFRQLHPSLRTDSDGLYVADEDGLKSLLFPFWGRTIEKGKRAYTANYILKRTSDAQGRLFPRTFIQMINEAIRVEKSKTSQGDSDRVLRFASLQAGVRAASEKRTDDLRTEYVELKPYLESLAGAPTVATSSRFKQAMKSRLGKPEVKLHMGPGGWDKVLDQLVSIGVFSKKSDSEDGDERYTAALMYRAGLGMKGTGLG